MTKTDEAELIEAIADQLDPSQRERIRLECERMKDEFHAHLDVSAAEKRDRLLAVKDTCLKAAKAIGALQDDDLPEGKFPLQDRQFELFFKSTTISTLLWVVSEKSAEIAEKLKPKARSTPEKDATAHYAFMMVADFGKAEPNRSPKGPYLTVALLLFEFFTGFAEQNLESSCRKVLEQYQPPRGGQTVIG